MANPTWLSTLMQVAIAFITTFVTSSLQLVGSAVRPTPGSSATTRTRSGRPKGPAVGSGRHRVWHGVFMLMLLCTLPGPCSASGDAMDEVRRLTALVETENACALPGCTIVYDRFVPVLQRAMSRGYVQDIFGNYVLQGLRYGFNLGVALGVLHGRRKFKNYKTAYDGHAAVSEAIQGRVDKGKTLRVGPWSAVKDSLANMFSDYFVFPMGAVPKPHQPEVMRPTSDHTKTGFNAATVMGILKHSLDTFKKVSWLLKQNYFMYVSDVEDAFPTLPLAPYIWAFMLFCWAMTPGEEEDLFIHLFADFGTRGAPGTFKVFLVDVVIQMAKSEFVLTLPLEVYVDDCGLIGAAKEEVDTEMAELQVFTTSVAGVVWKLRKDKPGSQQPLYIGFIWNSTILTLTLPEEKLKSYLFELAAAAKTHSLSLKERQSLAGKMQRVVKTLPPGAACLLVNCYALMSGLTMPWQRRRTTRAERMGYQVVHDLAELNLGQGYYSYALFETGPMYLSDASKSRDYTGGGYCGSDGFYDFFKYAKSATRRPIDFLEADVVRRACGERGHSWKGMLVPFGMDNQAFEKSVEAGRSRADRLNDVLIDIFALQIQENFILQPFWLSTHANYLSDHLSRDREGEFLSRVRFDGFVQPCVHLHRHPEAGRVVDFSDLHVDARGTLSQTGVRYSSNVSRDGPSRGRGVGGDAQLLSLAFQQASIYDGILPDFQARIDEVMDNRLSDSSMSKVFTAVKKWTAFCEEHDLPILLRGDDPHRGGKLASFVLDLTFGTELSYASISTYVWALRTWHELQHQPDPAYGVHHWRDFMQSVAVLTSVASEPRRAFDYDTLCAILDMLDENDLEQVQLGLLLVVMFFTFSRSETPCPKSFAGFNPKYHWQAKDFKLRKCFGSSAWVLWVRFKGYKQDPRIERPEASHAAAFLPEDLSDSQDKYGRDWVPIGDIPDDPRFSVSRWYMAYARLRGVVTDYDEPMFYARDRQRPYTYSCFMSDLKGAQERLGVEVKGTPHGIRVLAYNLSKRANGPDLTQAHGGWMSAAHTRYERWKMHEVLSIPAQMVGQPSQFASEIRDINRPRRPGRELVRRDETHPADDEGDGEAAAPLEQEGVLYPPGYSIHWQVSARGNRYFYITSPLPAGDKFYSRDAAWEHFSAARRGGTASRISDVAPSSPAVSAGSPLSGPGSAQDPSSPPHVPPVTVPAAQRRSRRAARDGDAAEVSTPSSSRGRRGRPRGS